MPPEPVIRESVINAREAKTEEENRENFKKGIDLIPSKDSKMYKAMMAEYEKRKNGTA